MQSAPSKLQSLNTAHYHKQSQEDAMSDVQNGNTPVDYVWVTHHDIYDDTPFLDNVSDKPWDADYDAPITRTHDNTKYRRADLPPTTEQIMADQRVQALVEALRECEAEIDQYIIHEYPSDHPVHERYRQRDFGANPARIALAQLKEPS